MDRPNRIRRRSLVSVTRALAIHYLSRQGGGTLTLDQAVARWATLADESLPADWRGERKRVLGELLGT
jgi:hypothetical protein